MHEAIRLGFLFYSAIEYFHLNFYEIPLKYWIAYSKNKTNSSQLYTNKDSTQWPQKGLYLKAVRDIEKVNAFASQS